MIHTPILIILLSLVTSSLSGSTFYFSLPFQTILNHTSAYHLVSLEINRYPYLIDFTLNSQPDHILSLQTAAQEKKLI